MGIFHGKAGKVIWDAEEENKTVLLITSWTFDATADVEDTSTMGTDTFKTKTAGWKDWTCEVRCRADSSGLMVDLSGYAALGSKYGSAGNETSGESATTEPKYRCNIELWFTQAAGGGIIYGPVICTNISHSQIVDGVPEVTYKFDGNGTPAVATSEPSYTVS